jgi:PRTRC genetic system protein C
MALQATTIQREFKYNGMTLTDPSPSKTPDQVRLFFAAQYPELTNAVIEGPTTKQGRSTYTFARAAGSKGASQATVLHRIVANGLPNHGSPLNGVTVSQLKENFKCSQVAAAIMNNPASLTPILPQAGAYSRFG